MSSGISNGGYSQPSVLRAAATSAAPSAEPCVASVPCLFGAPKPMIGLAADQRRTAFLRPRRLDRGANRLRVVPVDVRHDVPAIRLEALRRVVREPALDLAVDRDAVVVVEADQLAELLRARERARLVRDAFHQAAVAAEEIGVVIDDRRVGAIEVRRERALRERHADRVRDALAERPRGRLDADVDLALGMTGAARPELAEPLISESPSS